MASMRNWIAGAVTVLGILLVLGGAGTTLLRTWWKPGPGDTARGDSAPAPGPAPAQQSASELFGPTGVPPVPAAPAPTPAPAASGRPMFRLEAAERLIVWGIVLLVLAAVSAGAIGFDLSANAPVR
jgi:hypothetical protein